MVTLLAFVVGLIVGPLTLVGLLTVYLWINFLDEEVTDSSNIFNPIRVMWFSLTKPHKLLKVFPWIAKDEGDIIR